MKNEKIGMRNCEACNHQISDEAKVCPSCGHNVEKLTAVNGTLAVIQLLFAIGLTLYCLSIFF
jgi:hypothetical protein